MGLEIPFFVGVVNRSRQSLSIYSGEYLPIFFSEIGIPKQLDLDLVESSEINYSNSFISTSAGKYTARMPLVSVLAAVDRPEVFAAKGNDLAMLCSKIHGNISARRRREYIFKLDESGQARILPGPGSIQTFRQNLQLRLAEAFYNLQWLLENRPTELSLAEFSIYERAYSDMVNIGIDLPGLRGIYETVKKQLNKDAV